MAQREMEKKDIGVFLRTPREKKKREGLVASGKKKKKKRFWYKGIRKRGGAAFSGGRGREGEAP